MRDGIGRREFLKQQITAGVILGFPFLEGCGQPKGKEPTATPPKYLALALERMRAEARPGIVIVVPAEPGQAEALSTDLSYLIGATDAACKAAQKPTPTKGFVPPPVSGGDPIAQRLFCQAVFVCLTRADAARAFPDLKPDTAAVLLDPAGKLVDQLAAAPDLFKKDFGERMGAFLHGAKGERLAAHAAAQRAALGAEFCGKFDRAVRDLDSEDFETREKASKQLGEMGRRCPLMLAKAMTDSDGLEARYRIVKVFDGLYAGAPQQEPGPRLPYGMTWQQVQFDPCPGCGRVAMPAANREFLRLITEKPK
jgi:hypothetical protein